MAENTKIEWADHTFNPWIGCTIKSAGCKFCYAKRTWETQRKRVTWGPQGIRSLTSDASWRVPVGLNANARRLGVQQRIFCASLADVFDDHPSILPEWRVRLWSLIAATPNLEWLLLTKRPENWLHMLPTAAPYPGIFDNVRLGVSIEDQPAADERGVDLQLLHDLGWPTFVSYGPAIGPVDWVPLIAGGAIDWMVAEGESGSEVRQALPDYIRGARDACVPAGVPFLLKQWGEWMPADSEEFYQLMVSHPRFEEMAEYGQPTNGMYRVGKKNAGRTLDGVVWNQFPAPLMRMPSQQYPR